MAGQAGIPGSSLDRQGFPDNRAVHSERSGQPPCADQDVTGKEEAGPPDPPDSHLYPPDSHLYPPDSHLYPPDHLHPPSPWARLYPSSSCSSLSRCSSASSLRSDSEAPTGAEGASQAGRAASEGVAVHCAHTGNIPPVLSVPERRSSRRRGCVPTKGLRSVVWQDAGGPAHTGEERNPIRVNRARQCQNERLWDSQRGSDCDLPDVSAHNSLWLNRTRPAKRSVSNGPAAPSCVCSSCEHGRTGGCGDGCDVSEDSGSDTPSQVDRYMCGGHTVTASSVECGFGADPDSGLGVHEDDSVCSCPHCHRHRLLPGSGRSGCEHQRQGNKSCRCLKQLEVRRDSRCLNQLEVRRDSRCLKQLEVRRDSRCLKQLEVRRDRTLISHLLRGTAGVYQAAATSEESVSLRGECERGRVSVKSSHGSSCPQGLRHWVRMLRLRHAGRCLLLLLLLALSCIGAHFATKDLDLEGGGGGGDLVGGEAGVGVGLSYDDNHLFNLLLKMHMRPVPFSEFQTRLRNVRSKFDLLRIFLPDHHFSDDALRSLLTSPSPHVDTLARPDDVNHLAPLTLPTVDGEQDAEVTATPQDSNGPGAGTGALKNGRVSSASGVGLEKPPAQPAMPGPPGSAPHSDTVLTRTGKSGSAPHSDTVLTRTGKSGSAPHSDTVLTRTGKSGSAPHSDTVLTRTGKSGSAPHSDTVLTRTGKSLEDVLGRDDSGGVSADLVPAKGDSMVKSPGVQADVLLNGRTAVNSGSAGKKSRQKDATQDHSVTQPGLKKRAELTNEDADYDDDDDDDDAVDEEDYLDGEVEYYNDQSNTDALLEGLEEVAYHIEEMESSPQMQCRDPQPHVVHIQDPKKQNRQFFPECTVVYRCRNDSGCCGKNHECGPKTERVIIRTFLAVHVNTTSDTVLPDSQMVERIALVNHTSCQCREKPRLPECSQQCPGVFQMYRYGWQCVCDCTASPNERFPQCQAVKDGLSPLSHDDLVCIKAGRCARPKCTIGQFDVSSGFCPVKDVHAIPSSLLKARLRHQHQLRHARRKPVIEGSGDF